MEISELVRELRDRGQFSSIATNVSAQFGTPTMRFLGAQFLPERNTNDNSGAVNQMKARPLMANASTRHSPVQRKSSLIWGSYKWQLADNDVGEEFTADDYDAVLDLLRQSNRFGDRPSMEAATKVLNFVDNMINAPMLIRNEWDRWQAIVNASVTQHGSNAFVNTLTYPNPTGHRVTVGGTWSNNSYNPLTDMIAMVNFLKAKGYIVTRAVTGTDVVTILKNNQLLRQMGGMISIASGSVVGLPQMLDDVKLAALLQNNGIPPLEVYDDIYYTTTGSGYFFPRGTVVYFCRTQEPVVVDRGDLQPIVLPDAIGFTGIGRASGQSGAGRVIKVKVIDDEKPPRVKAEGWQVSAPVIEDPESVAVMSGIS